SRIRTRSVPSRTCSSRRICRTPTPLPRRCDVWPRIERGSDRVTLDLVFGAATEADASAIARLRTDAAERLTRDFGRGHWSSTVSETGVLSGMRGSYVLVVRDAAEIAGTLTLSTRKPWAINPAYFSNVRRPLYLTD